MKSRRILIMCILTATIICVLTASLVGQQKKQTSAAAPSSPNTVKLAPPEVRQRLFKLVAARKPVTITIPIAVTPAKLKHQDVMLKLEKQKQSVDALRMTLAPTRSAGQQQSAPPPQSRGGGGGVQGAKSNPSLIQRSEITPVTNIGTIQSRSTPNVSPVVNPNIAKVGVCHGATISTVNGQASGATFTTDPNHNDNIIEGCGFGNQKGSVYLSGPFATPLVRLNVSYWADTWIDVQMDQNFSGELDHLGNVTLVVAPANGPQAQAKGFSFYAVRARVQLTRFPRSQTVFQPTWDAAGQNTVKVDFWSPPSSAPSDAPGGIMAPGATLEVNRSDAGRFGGVIDAFYFNQLSSGFYLETIDFRHFDMTSDQCQADYYVDGYWEAWWVGVSNQLRVAAEEQHCHWSPTVNTPSYDYSFSIYAVSVWVVGPKGANPWAVQQ